jgi:hypothetical protein
VLRFVADNARVAAAMGASSQLQVAFFAVLTAEVLQASPRRVGEDTVVRLGVLAAHSRGGCSSAIQAPAEAGAHCAVQDQCVVQALLLPNVRTGLVKGSGIDLRAAAHIVLAQLASRATLSNAVLSGAMPLNTSHDTFDYDAV